MTKPFVLVKLQEEWELMNEHSYNMPFNVAQSTPDKSRYYTDKTNGMK